MGKSVCEREREVERERNREDRMKELVRVRDIGKQVKGRERKIEGKCQRGLEI
jgi:hypothetical protein